MSCPCCQLHVHSTHSFFDGLAPVEDLVARAVELEQPGIALTNHGNLYGAAALFKATKKAGIKGVIGMEAYEAVPHTWDPEQHADVFKQGYDPTKPRYFHLTMWAANQQGWENLCALHTLSFTPEYKPKNQPLIDRANLERYGEGLIIGLGCVASRTNITLANNDDAYEAAKWYVETFPGRVYMEIMGNTEDQQRLMRPQRKLAQRLGVQTVGTNDVHYVRREDGVLNGAHHILVQGRRWKKKEGAEASNDMSDAGYGQWYGSDGFYLKSGDEMLATGLQREEVERTVEILDRTDFDFDKLPRPKPPIAVIPEPGEDASFDAWLGTVA